MPVGQSEMIMRMWKRKKFKDQAHHNIVHWIQLVFSLNIPWISIYCAYYVLVLFTVQNAHSDNATKIKPVIKYICQKTFQTDEDKTLTRQNCLQ